MRKRVILVGLIVLMACALLVYERVAVARPAPTLTAADLLGAVRVRDVDVGAPSLRSDRLVFNLTGVQSPPSGFALQAYLAAAENGFFCGELSVSGGAVNAVLDYPGANLIERYDSLRMMWEQEVFAATLPTAALALIREVVARADDTPSNVGYGVGLVQEARMLLTHANLAQSSAAAGSLAGARVHTEHVLNILYGAADPRHGDYDGNGVAENPGDGFGLLRYAANVDLNMLTAAESAGVTDHIFNQAVAASAVIGNFAPADGGNTWSDQLVVQAAQVLASGSAAVALTLSTAARDLAMRIVDGIDANSNGVVDEIAGEGGAVTAFTAVQRAADYFPPGPITGLVEHGASTNNPTSDRILIALDNVPAPPGGFTLWGYLVAPNGERLLLGELPWSNGKVEASFAYAGRNLIAEFGAFRLAHGAIYAEDKLPVAPLTALRKVLATADDTPNRIGYGVGLMQQAQLLRDLAAQSSAAAQADNLALAKQRAGEALNVLVGPSDPRFNAAFANPGDGFGLLRHAAGSDLALSQVAGDAAATVNMATQALAARTALANFAPAAGQGTWSDQLITQIQQVLAASTAAAAAPAAGQAALLADRILNGAGSDGGTRAAYQSSQAVSDYFPTEAGASQPTQPPAPGVNPDAFENDDVCSRAVNISTEGAPQRRTFHYEGDQDWVRFTAQANKSYVIDVTGVGALADPVVFLYDACDAAPGSFENNAFGNSVRLIWNATRNGTYYIQLRQFDPAVFGENTEYDLRVTLDTTPPSPPTNLRCLAIDQNTLAIQWRRSPEFDVAGYQVTYGNQAATDTGIRDVAGADVTFIELGGLTPNELYFLTVTALDFSRNVSAPSGELQCRPVQPADATRPTITALQPTAAAVFTTTAPSLTFSGAVQDAGGNLSRVRVRNASINQERTDFTLAGAAAEFRVQDVPLRVGVNDVRVTAFDEANNSTEQRIEVRRLADSAGAVIIVAGHNETFGLQTNIYNAANRAYRIFLSAGFAADDIYYLAPAAQDADGDGTPDTRNVPFSPAAVEQAIKQFAAARVGPGKPLYLYLMDHGFADRYCVTGCTAGNVVTPKELNEWLRTVEDQTGANEVNIFIEACQSGSFLDNLEGAATNPLNSLARQGRVVITSTGRVNNAYASADGAFFSDAFFSCLADSGSMKACFDEAATAVALTGVDQTPWLDDNADGVPNSGDGATASQRTLTRFFSSVRPRIMSTDVTRSGQSGLLTAEVEAGAEALRLVWAAVYPPSFQEPSGVTLNLNVPIVRLEPDSTMPGRFAFNYVDGFTEQGDYRVVFYAQDRLGIGAPPRRHGDAGEQLYLPVIAQ